MKIVTVLILAVCLAGGAAFYFFYRCTFIPTALGGGYVPASGGELLPIPAGQFLMGSENGRPDETTHTVVLSAFWMDKTPVTQEVYERAMGGAANRSKHKGKQFPVEQITWFDAIRFCNRCSEIDGLTPCYDAKTGACDFGASGYRLPTEAEWEYGCRAGTRTRFDGGDEEPALLQCGWCKVNSGGTTHAVAQKRPNAWGLFDMHGNVWQWCNDFYADDYYGRSAAENPRGQEEGKRRVLRGGAWDCPPEKCGASYRFNETASFADVCYGGFDCYGIRRVRSATASGNDAKSATTLAANTAAPVLSVSSAPRATVAAPSLKAGKIDIRALRGTVIFASERSGVLKIWSMHANGTDAKQLTSGDTADADPRFSPDGKSILFTTLRGGFPEIWRMNRDGSEPRKITSGSQGAWSPDGASIVFVRDNQTFIRALAGGAEVRVTPENWQRCGVPAWSPDGLSIAVASRHLESIGIFILDTAGTAQAQLKTGDAACTPTWSADGKRLLCQTVQGHVFQVERDGKNWEQITFGADVQHDARYSPDGTMLIFARAPAAEGPWQLCVQLLSDEDGAYVPLTNQGSNLQPDWDGRE